MNPLPDLHVELGMYPFPSVAWAWDELWAAVHARAPWTPTELTRSGDVHARWSDPNCVVTQICGWPFAAWHRHDFHVVGAFALTIDGATTDARYRSVLLSPHDRSLRELVTTDTRAVANSADSLSGWVSLLNATVGPDGDWPGTVTYTNAHIESVVTLAQGEADLACIDAWSLSFIADQQPELVGGLHRIADGPLIPTPAVTVRRTIADGDVAQLRTAFAETLVDPSLAGALSALRIDGFAALTLENYLATLSLSTARP